MDLLGHGLDDADDDVLQPLPLGVVVQDEAVSLLGVRAAERRSAHAGVDGSQVVMESIEVLEQQDVIQTLVSLEAPPSYTCEKLTEAPSMLPIDASISNA